MSPECSSWTAWQRAFASRIRNPGGTPRPPGVPARRMRVYEDLLFNNLEGFLLACYPVTRRLLGARAWRRSVRRFFIEHRCLSPLFRDIPEAFLTWMRDLADAQFPALPFLAELMHYEWLELAVEIAPGEIDPSLVDPRGDLLGGRPVLNPTARLACYHYPVHRIGPRYKPQCADSHRYCYLLYRDAQDTVRFIALNPLSAQLLNLLHDGRWWTGGCALTHLAGEISPDRREAFLAAGRALLEQLRSQGVLLGTWRAAADPSS